MIELHYWPTPNGKKVTILLEELGVPYKIVPVNIGKGDQFTAEYLKLNPNNRMPALVDTEPADGGAPLSVFESGAIMMYLAEKFGKFYPQDLRSRYEINQWLIWQVAGRPDGVERAALDLIARISGKVLRFAETPLQSAVAKP